MKIWFQNRRNKWKRQLAADAGSTGIKFQVYFISRIFSSFLQRYRWQLNAGDVMVMTILLMTNMLNLLPTYYVSSIHTNIDVPPVVSPVVRLGILNTIFIIFVKPNYLPILNSQYLSGINYLNAASAAAVAASTSKSAPTTSTSPDKAALLEKLSNSLNQSLVSEGISSP